ncbi:MAG: YceI family protein [Thermoleophilia bacterium]|nr:YceI family protein [Thermoleophilia bacterium]
MPTGVWHVDPAHSTVEFQVKHMMIATVKGRFTGFEGSLHMDEGGPKLAGTIEVATLDTHETGRDEHLRSPDFFDAAEYPEIRFRSTLIEPASAERFRVVGDLTIKDVTRPVELEATLSGPGRDPWGNERVALEVRGGIDRKDFGLTWNQALETGGVLVGDRVKLLVDIEAIKAEAV